MRTRVESFRVSEPDEGDSQPESLTVQGVRPRPKLVIAPGDSAGEASLESRNHSSRDVLVVDDDADIRRSMVSALKAEGYRAISASNGVQALELLRVLATPPAVILLDLMMPVMDGWEFRTEQQRDPLLSTIPVVVFSAHDNLPEEASRIAASGYLTKPFRLQDLLDTIRKFCRDPV